MKLISFEVHLISIFFPDNKNEIFRRFHRDHTFREVCKDYLHCYNILKYWQHSYHPKAQERQREYQLFLSSLDEELVRMLEEKSIEITDSDIL